jgi:hypothetical protein
MEKINLEKTHKGKRHIFSFGFYKMYLITFEDYGFFFQLVNIYNLKALKFGF